MNLEELQANLEHTPRKISYKQVLVILSVFGISLTIFELLKQKERPEEENELQKRILQIKTLIDTDCQKIDDATFQCGKIYLQTDFKKTVTVSNDKNYIKNRTTFHWKHDSDIINVETETKSYNCSISSNCYNRQTKQTFNVYFKKHPNQILSKLKQ